MPTASDRFLSRTSPVLLLIPVLAVFFGIAAVLLSGGLGVGPTIPGPSSSGSDGLNSVTTQEVVDGVVIALGLGLSYRVLQRIRGQTISPPAQFLAGALAFFLVAIAFLVVAHFVVHPSAHPFSLPPSGGPHGSGSSSANNTTLPTPSPPPGSSSGVFPPGWPWWIPYLILGAIGLTIGGLAIPALAGRAPPARRIEPSTDLGKPEAALRSALAALDPRSTDDPRSAIITLYGALLGAVGDRTGPVDPMTPREVARGLVAKLGVSPEVARELTERFEEARYSVRPLTSEAVPRTRSAISQALREISGSRARA